MPTPTENYQASIRGVLMGVGTDYIFTKPGISGLGNPRSKTADVQLDGQDGAYASPEYMDVRTILIPLVISETTDTAAWNALKALKIAWMPSTSDLELHVQLPGWGHIYYLGRPRSLDDDCELVHDGVVTCIAEFLATDPHAHDA